MLTAGAGGTGEAGDASRRAGVLAAAVLCLLLAQKAVYAADPAVGGAGQVPYVAALFVLPVLYVFTGTRDALARYRWLVLAVQAVLTWVPFAVFGGRWDVGVAGLLAGLVLLMVTGPVSWLLAGGLLAADLVVRGSVVGLPGRPRGRVRCGRSSPLSTTRRCASG
jgi:two-component system, NarL family, sensor histidine kinase DesK